MCRSIKSLRLPDRLATEQELHEAALQYVRKVSGYRKPSKANQVAFDAAITEVAVAGFARVPCGRTHPKRTDEVGRIELKRDNIGKGKERIEVTILPR